MEVWSLKCFLAVADALSFSKAAETLYVSQPAISQQISEIERQLGVELFDRSKRRIRLTPAGAALYHEAHDIVLRHDSLPELVRKAVEENTPRRCFRLGFERGVAWSTGFRARIQQVNEELERTHANLVISTDTVEQAGVVDLLRENRIDMAFVFEDTAPDMAWAETFPTRCSENMYLVYRVEEALLGLSAREILMEKGVVMTGGDPVGTQQCYRLLSALGAQPKIQMCRDIVDAVMVAESGSRAGLFLECIARRVQERGMIKRELTEYPVRIKALCRRKGCSPLTEEFLRLLWEREKAPD